MPVDFLTAEQTKRYGHFQGDPSPAQLAKYFFLDDNDRAEIASHRGAHNRLGYAVQLCTVRFLGAFLPDPLDVPKLVVQYLAEQLAITDPDCLARYRDRRPTHHEHVEQIRQRHGYCDFSAQPEHWRLVRWLYTRAWLSAERPVVLFDLATARMVERKVLLPGATTLARLVASVSDRAAMRLWRSLAELPNRNQRKRLEGLLTVPDTQSVSALDRLRRASVHISAPGMVDALGRFTQFRDLGVTNVKLVNVPAGRVKVLARYAAAARAQAIERMQHDRRVALLAFARVYETVAQDDAVDLLNQLISAALRRADSKGTAERLRTIPDLDRAALRLRDAMRVVLDDTQPDEGLRAAIFALIARQQLEEDVQKVSELSRGEDESHYYEHLVNHYTQMRRFLPMLLNTIDFRGSIAAQPVLKALAFLRERESEPDLSMEKAPRGVITKGWRKLVLADEIPDHRFYTLCTLERLQDGLHRRDVYLADSERWADPRAKLLQGEVWRRTRPAVCRTLSRQPDGEAELSGLAEQLEQAYRRAADSLPSIEDVRIEKRKGRDRLCVTPLDKLDEPASLITLRQRVNALIPRVDLPEALLEAQALTGFADEFHHISERDTQVENLALSVCAVLTAEACNINLEPVVRNEIPALSYARLAWVQQNHIRAETLTRANACLVREQSRIPLVKAWGGGEVASADGLRFVVPVHTLHGGHNSKYFHAQRGVTYYNFMSNQFSGFHGIVIPGTLGESPYLLDGLLEHQTELQPLQMITDTAGYSDMVFGLFWLLGFQFSPRLADIGEARLWRIDREAHYGVLNGVARNHIHRDLIIGHWDDMLRVVGSLKMGTVKASDLIRGLQRGNKISTLGRAIGELGRIPKTLHLLNFIADEDYRRHCLNQLNRHEGRNGLARRVFHGQKGELGQRYREGQEDQLGALGLVVNALILWTTRYTDAALNKLKAEGVEVRPEDMARLSPLGSKQPRVSVTPASGTVPPGVPQHFQFTLQDTDGASQIRYADLYFGQERDCHLGYSPPNSLQIMQDDGSSSGTSLGSANVLRNGQCSVDLRTASAVASGDRIDLALDVVFSNSFQGVQPLAASVFDQSGGESVQQRLGVWTIGSGSCSVTASVSPTSFPANGGSGSVQINAPAGCAWSLAVAPGWISIGQISGNGNASIPFTVSANTGGLRDWTLATGGRLLTVQQAGAIPCAFQLTLAPNVVSSADVGVFDLSANGSACPWSIAGAPPWLTPLVSSGKGSARIFFKVDANPTDSDRTAQLAVGGIVVGVNQPSNCIITMSATTSQFPAQGGSSSLQISANMTGCVWTIFNPESSWLRPDRTSGTGSGSVPFTIIPNASTASRSALISVASAYVVISQAGKTCSTSAVLTPVSFPGSGGTGTVQINSDAACPWELRNVPLWILPFWAMGAGPANFAFTVTPNTGAGRSVTIDAAGTPVTITQGPAVCAVTATAPVTSFAASGGAGTIQIASYVPGCSWSISGVPSWITIPVVGGTGTPQTIDFRVAANAGPARSATITAGTSSIVITQAAGSLDTAGLRFVAVSPCRAVDTRVGQGKTGPFGPPALAAGESRTLPLAAAGCGVPASAKAYAVNATVSPLAPLGFLTLWPSGQTRSLVSTLNAMEGQIVANAAIVPAGAGGAINAFASGATDVILDINGYFTDQAEAELVFYPMTPCRVIDTRQGQGIAGTFGPPSLNAALPRSFPLAAGRCGIPLRARAVSLNLTAVPHGQLGYLSAWPTGQPRPLVSTLNSFDGRIVANAAIVPAGSGASIDVFASNPTDLIADVNGYFAPDDGAGLFFHAVNSCRAVDTRFGSGIGGDLGMPSMNAGQSRDFDLPRSTCGLPANAAAWSAKHHRCPRRAARVPYRLARRHPDAARFNSQCVRRPGGGQRAGGVRGGLRCHLDLRDQSHRGDCRCEWMVSPVTQARACD